MMVALYVVLIAGSVFAQERTASIELMVRVEGISSDAGLMAFALYDTRSSFPNSPSDIALGPIVEGVAFRPFRVVPGTYAVIAFQDLNSNGRLDRNFIGLPKEPYVVSGTHRRRGPPSWKRAKMTLVNDQEIVLMMSRDNEQS